MRILFAAPMVTRPNSLDPGWYHFYLPLGESHETYFFDTGRGGNEELAAVVNGLEPDLIFSVATGDRGYCPREPWEALAALKERIPTFNWFCDSTWRWEWERSVREVFSVCSSTEAPAVTRHRADGYRNIFEANWCVNEKLFRPAETKTHDVTFIGGLHGGRGEVLQVLESEGFMVYSPVDLPLEEMVKALGQSRICLNFSKDSTGLHTQQKLRPFEVTACRSCLVSEFHPGIERYFIEDREAFFFRSVPELKAKLRFLLNNHKILDEVARAGYDRTVKEHSSTVRLTGVLHEITRLDSRLDGKF